MTSPVQFATGLLCRSRRCSMLLLAPFILQPCLCPLAAQSPLKAPAKVTSQLGQLSIHGGDLLNVNTFDEPQLTTSARVSPDGDISIPLVGAVHVAGRTPEQAAATIRDLFQAKKLLLHPQVSVLVAEYATAGISVSGEVKNPGIYTLLGDHTLLDAITAAGGITPAADTTVLIKRRGSDQDTVSVHLNVDNAHASASNDVPVYPNDLVIVPRAGIIYVLGDVAKPGGFTMRNDGRMTVLEAISEAQGTSKTASLHTVKLLRKQPDGEVETINIPFKRIQQGKSEDVSLVANDVIYVPNSAFKSSAATLAGLGGAVATAVIYTSH